MKTVVSVSDVSDVEKKRLETLQNRRLLKHATNVLCIVVGLETNDKSLSLTSCVTLNCVASFKGFCLSFFGFSILLH